MKKLTACLLCLILLFQAAAWADPVPTKTAVTIDGIRAAFFSAEGDYLQPLEENGQVWVPAVSLGENLGMNITADPDSATVSKDGVKVAVFDADGNYVAPIVVDGTVYVPLAAFAESIGLQCEVSEGAVALVRPGAQQAVQPTPAPTPVPTEAPPEFVWIDLTNDNFDNYFSVTLRTSNFSKYEKNYTKQRLYFTYWQVDVYLYVTAKNSYEYRNVSFYVNASMNDYVNKNCGGKVVSFSNLTMPPSGELTRGQTVDTLYIGYSYMISESDAVYGRPNVNSVRGQIAVPRTDLLPGWQRKYDQAMKDADEGKFDEAIAALEYLAENQYEDSADQLAKMRVRKDETAEQERADRYRNALDLVDKGQFEKGIEILTELSEIEYNDSKDQLAAATEKWHQAMYDHASDLMGQGKYNTAHAEWLKLSELGYKDSADQLEKTVGLINEEKYRQAMDQIAGENFEEAIRILTPLAEKEYSDSKAQLEKAKQGLEDQRRAKYDPEYQAALEKERERRFEEAEEAFKPLADADYMDSADHLAKNKAAAQYLKELREAYRAGIDAEAAGKWEEALDHFMACLDYSNARAHAAACMLNAEDRWALPPVNGGFLFQRGDISGYANTATGEFRIFTDYEYHPLAVSDFWKNGVELIRSGTQYGLINAAGEVVQPVEWKSIEAFGDKYIIAKKDERTLAVLDNRGQQAFEGTWRPEGTAKYAMQLVRTDGLDEKLLLFPDGRSAKCAAAEFFILSSDGRFYRVRSSGDQETLLSPDGEELFTAERIYHDIQAVNQWECFHLCNGVIAFRKDGKWGLYDVTNNKQLAKPAWDDVFPFTAGGAARVTVKKKYGMINTSGKMAAQAKYVRMGQICDGLAQVAKPGKKKINNRQASVTFYGFVNEDGKEVIPMKYIGAGDFSQGFGVTWVGVDEGVFKGNKRLTKISFYFLNKEGKEVFSIKGEIRHENLKAGKMIFPGLYFMPFPNSSGLKALFNASGEKMFNCVSAEQISPSLAVASRTKSKPFSYTVVDAQGNKLLEIDKQGKQLTIEAVSTENGHLISISDGRRLLYRSGGERWTEAAPEAAPEPDAESLAAAARQAGIE